MDELYDKIDRYLLDRMASDEKSRFENETSSDKSLEKEVELRKLLIDGIRPYAIVHKAEDSYWEEMGEIIDRYLLDQMTDNEKRRFEERLKWDAELRDHLETQRLIMLGIRLEAAEKTIQGIELGEKLRATISLERALEEYPSVAACVACEPSIADSETGDTKIVSRIPWHRKFAYGIAAAACFFFLLIPVGHYSAITYGENAFISIERSSERSARGSVSKLVEAGDYDTAIKKLSQELEFLKSRSQETIGLTDDLEQTIYELASVQLLNGDVRGAKETLELYTPGRVQSSVGDKILELRKKLWWIIW